MIIIKIITLIFILGSSSYIGILISNKYLNRVKELNEIKTALNMLENKIKFTYEPLPEIFKELSNVLKPSISNIFINASNYMDTMTAGKAWEKALLESNTSLIKEDIETIKNLGNLLGKVDIEGQISEIELVNSFLDTQIELAQQDKNKYCKMYKTLGITIGLAIVIILI